MSNLQEFQIVAIVCKGCARASYGAPQFCGPQHRPDWGGFRYVRCRHCSAWNRLEGVPPLYDVAPVQIAEEAPRIKEAYKNHLVWPPYTCTLFSFEQ